MRTGSPIVLHYDGWGSISFGRNGQRLTASGLNPSSSAERRGKRTEQGLGLITSTLDTIGQHQRSKKTYMKKFAGTDREIPRDGLIAYAVPDLGPKDEPNPLVSCQAQAAERGHSAAAGQSCGAERQTKGLEPEQVQTLVQTSVAEPLSPEGPDRPSPCCR